MSITVESITPNSGPREGGTEVVIKGTGFVSGVTSIDAARLVNGIESIPLVNLTVVDDETILAETGAALGYGLFDLEIDTTETPPQTATIEFTAPSSSIDVNMSSPPGSVTVRLTTSDGLPLVGTASVNVVDLLTGTAVDPTHYAVNSPDPITFAPGSLHNATATSAVNFVAFAPGVPRTIDLQLQTPSGCVIGPQATHTVTLVGGGGES